MLFGLFVCLLEMKLNVITTRRFKGIEITMDNRAAAALVFILLASLLLSDWSKFAAREEFISSIHICREPLCKYIVWEGDRQRGRCEENDGRLAIDALDPYGLRRNLQFI